MAQGVCHLTEDSMKHYSQPHFTVRLPKPLRSWLVEQAEVNNRSINAELTFRLEMSKIGLQPSTGQSGEPAAGNPARS
jgi:hypothetical protein